MCMYITNFLNEKSINVKLSNFQDKKQNITEKMAEKK